MKPIEEVYPDLASTSEDGGYFYSTGNYSPMLESFGYEILLQVDDDDYQGDSRLLYRDGDRIGYLQFGWGSCSGCDSLQACDSMKEIDELRSSLFDKIQWFDDDATALKWFSEHDWEGDYSWHHDKQKEFVAKAKAILGCEGERGDA